MIRTILQTLVPFLLPFILYGLWLWVLPHRDESLMGRMRTKRYWLSALGIGCSIIALVVLGISRDNDAQQDYVPPRLVDGKIVPGTFEE
ncbi:MAG: DUF6111 family protein [Pseudomonadota bacterium]